MGTEDENDSEEVTEVNDLASKQMLAFDETESDEMIMDNEPIDGEDEKELIEATSRVEESQVDAAVTDPEPTQLSESNSEGKSVFQDDEPELRVPSDDANGQIEKRSARQRSQFESSGMVS